MANRLKSPAPALLLRVITAAGASILVALITANVAQMQSKKPYDQGTLLRVVQLNALPTSEVVEKINERGVDFQMTSQIESEFRSAGARPEVIQSMRANYRSATPEPPHDTRPNTRPSTNVPAGPPLSKSEIRPKAGFGRLLFHLHSKQICATMPTVIGAREHRAEHAHTSSDRRCQIRPSDGRVCASISVPDIARFQRSDSGKR